MAAGVVVDAAIALHASQPSRRAPVQRLVSGIALDKPLPDLRLTDEHGHATSLRSLRGRFVVLAPSLTLCHEVCPLTTAALDRVAATVRRRGLTGRVTVAEVSVDPWRDSPARLRAFRRLTGTRLALYTGSHAELRRFWKVLGVHFERTKGDGDTDWWTGRRLRMDVSHTDGVFVIDPRGHLRLFAGGMPDAGPVPARLRALLNAQGRRNLARPASPWSVDDLLGDLWRLMRVRPPASPPSSAPAAPPAGTLADLRRQAARLLPGGAAALTQRIAALRGHPIVINAWASWCPPCRAEFPLFAAAARRYGGQVAFLGLDTSDSDGHARTFLATHPIPYPSYSDDESHAAHTLGRLQGLPTTVFLDRRGKLRFAHTGAYHGLAALEDDIAAHALP
jgi:cytochrome c biogenesis protein CcmG/thiol:disulfide interchange protein DsbE